MFKQKSLILPLLLALAVAAGAQAQTGPGHSRITERIDPGRRFHLSGQVHPLAQARFDRGAAPADLPMATCSCC